MRSRLPILDKAIAKEQDGMFSLLKLGARDIPSGLFPLIPEIREIDGRPRYIFKPKEFKGAIGKLERDQFEMGTARGYAEGILEGIEQIKSMVTRKMLTQQAAIRYYKSMLNIKTEKEERQALKDLGFDHLDIRKSYCPSPRMGAGKRIRKKKITRTK